MLTVLTGAKYTSIISFEHYGRFLLQFTSKATFTASTIINSIKYSSGSTITVSLTTSEAITTQNNDKFIPNRGARGYTDRFNQRSVGGLSVRRILSLAKKKQGNLL